jgi:multicomponent K+:H+ antiporter subunit E
MNPQPPTAGPRRWLAHPLLSALLALLFVLMYQSLSPAVVLWAIGLGVLIPWLAHPFLAPGSRVHAAGTALHLALIVLWDILVSNLTVARIVLSPWSRPQPAWVPVPLALRHEGAITLFATIITNTPGTVSCIVDEERRLILVHALDCSDVAEAAAQMKQRYEQPLQRIFEGAARGDAT